MINFFLVSGRVTKVELSRLSVNNRKIPTKFNITIDDVDGPIMPNKIFVQVVSRYPALERELRHLEDKSIPVLAHCYISSSHYPGKTEDSKGKNYFEISLIKLWYFKNHQDLTALKNIKEEIANNHQEFLKNIAGLENIGLLFCADSKEVNKIIS